MEAFQIDRHFKLWEEKNKALKRATFATVVISIAIIANVLVPYVHSNKDERKELAKSIKPLEKELADYDKKIAAIAVIENVLNKIKTDLNTKPWETQKNKLIDEFKKNRNLSASEYQQKANDTIYAISDTLEKHILAPFKDKIGATSQTSILTKIYNDLSHSIDAWKKSNINKNWYRTIPSKERTMLLLDLDLNTLLSRFSTEIETELRKIEKEKEPIENNIKTMNEEIKKVNEKLDKIDVKLSELLPSWLRVSGLITTILVIQVLPLFLLGSAIYVFVVGLDLTRHYQLYVTGKALNQDITTDPSMSSTWTLIARGRYGTLFTIAAYVLFFALIWVLLEISVNLLKEWIEIGEGKAWVNSTTVWELYLWLCRLIFIALIAYVCIRPRQTNGFHIEPALIGSHGQ